MENLLFDNNIKVSVTQSPISPIMGDDVTFRANVFLSNPSSNYTTINNYFFSYTWLVSNDGGNNFYQVGSDLEELIIYNIDQTFFNNIYKVQVALIDLDNIILTEDGNNLTTQFGEILLNNSNISSLNIQAVSNNSSTMSVSPTSKDSNIEALNITNLQSIITEATAFDTTITEQTSSEILSGQVTLDKFENSQTINGNLITPVTVEELPDPIIGTDLNQQSIMSSTKFGVQKKEFIIACDTKLSYDVCKPSSLGYSSLEDCLSLGNACSEDDMITISLTNFDKSDPNESISIGKKIGYAPNYLIYQESGSPDDTNYIISTTVIKAGCCPGNLIEICPYEIKKGYGDCDPENSAKYLPKQPIQKCKDSFIQQSRLQEVSFSVDPNEITSDCGCNAPNNISKDVVANLIVIDQTDSTVTIEENISSFDLLAEKTSDTNISNINSESVSIQVSPVLKKLFPFIFKTKKVKFTRDTTLVPDSFTNNPHLSPYVRTQVDFGELDVDISPWVTIAESLGYVAKTVAIKVLPSVAKVLGAGGAIYSVGTGSYQTGAFVSSWTLVPLADYLFGGPSQQLKQLQCKNTIFKQVYKCVDTKYSSNDDSQYITCNINLDAKQIDIDSYEDLRKPEMSFNPKYTCNCIRSNGDTYVGSITIKKWSTDDLLSQGLSIEEINSFDYGCKWYVTEHTGKPDSNCECNLNISPEDSSPNSYGVFPDPISIANYDIKKYIDIQKTYNFTIPGINPDYFTVNSQDIVDCVTPVDDKCNAKCEGFYCCNNGGPQFVWELGSGTSDPMICNQDRLVQSPDISDLPAATENLTKCSEISTNTVPVVVYTSLKRVKTCTDTTDDLNGPFSSHELLVSHITSNLTSGSIGVLFNYEETNSTDEKNKKLIASKIIASDGHTVLMPNLYKHAKVESKGVQTFPDNKCDLCKVLYTISTSGSNYPCDDKSFDANEFCGWKPNCNIDDSTDSTSYIKVTINQKTNPTPEDIKLIHNRPGSYYDNFGQALSDAQTLAEPRGIVVSNPCPK